jgi:hypothetical protein
MTRQMHRHAISDDNSSEHRAAWRGMKHGRVRLRKRSTPPRLLLAAALAATFLPCVGCGSSAAVEGMHWKTRPAPRESFTDYEASDDDEYMLRDKTREDMQNAVNEEGARVARIKKKMNIGSGFVARGLPVAEVEEDGSVHSMSRSRKDPSVWYADEALREAVEERPDVFQHPPIEDSDELSVWFAIAEAQAKAECILLYISRPQIILLHI